MADGDYISLADTKTLIKRVDAVYEVSGVVDDDHLTLIIDEAEGMINSAIASRYDVPVTNATAIKYLRALVVPIIRYKTFTQFADQEDFPEGIKVEYKSTMKQLDNLAKRVTSLPAVDDKTTGRASYIKISTSTSSISKY
jgi:phage gp36-like protein